MNRRQRAFGNGTLIIDQVQRSADAGTYTCQAQNRQKQSARKEVEVQVLGEKFIDILTKEEEIMKMENIRNNIIEGLPSFNDCSPL